MFQKLKEWFHPAFFVSSERKNISMKMGVFSSAEVENTTMVIIVKNFRTNTLTEAKRTLPIQ